MRIRSGLVVALVCALGLTFRVSAAATNELLPRVRLETAMGNIDLELDAKHAPITVSNFLRYVDGGMYSNATFFRTVTLSNQPTNDIKIQVIQAQANPARRREFFPPIPLERTRDTSLHHQDGALSMARNGPDTARDSFSIVIGEQPEMDFGGKRNPDGQGFAVFGHVVTGMEVVRKIQAQPADGQRLTTPVRILNAIRIK